ncbi:3-phosphoshikimate 1-carboxyvinyltransferase [Haliscomenobacter sp.]|uniref:3-phosphoshikimate 1-carboxyvinyltransferase n=1 Tax=Haliscomenobacter sp. TaxID=2717303 RepID=UPI003365189E
MYAIYKNTTTLSGEITLAGSKSISNRTLIIRALCGEPFPIAHLANAKDTDLLQGLLASTEAIRDAGAAGTTFRFMTAYLSTQEGTQTLTGTERMKLRPIGVLVDALCKLGANIEYLEKEGYPPLQIGPPDNFGINNKIQISASTSSQYISALLMIAPTLPNGLELELVGKIVSRPYIEMTLSQMAYFGVQHEWEGQFIWVAPQQYQPKPFVVEADWSAASYYYAMAAFATEVDLQLNGLFEESLQGDAVLTEIMTSLGVKTSFNPAGVHLSKTGAPLPEVFEYDFLKCPDLAQTIAVVCAGLGVIGRFTGLETLRIKETDRIAALDIELAKIGVNVIEEPLTADGKAYFRIEGKAVVPAIAPEFATYEDHRMAMAFAPLAFMGPIKIHEPEVVVKSYPDFWRDLQAIGFSVV